MKHLPLLFYCGLLLAGCSKKTTSGPPTTGGTDSASLTVVNGYGSGIYKVGDTVDIWSMAVPANAVFGTWTGYGSLMENAGEWHNQLVMPAQDLTLTASQTPISPFQLKYEQIRAVNILKNVYYFFPPNHRGIVYLCHGTGGNAHNLVTTFEWIEMINELVSVGFAVVVTEAEEVSLNTDTNGDGKIRWAVLPVDTLANVDFANIRVLTDTFAARGYTQSGIPRYSIGMSDGGFFSSSLSFLYHFSVGVSYCAPTSTTVTSASTTPLQFCMAKYDNAPEVGPAGNATAQTNSSSLMGRGVCSPYFVHDHSPVYPQRFARRGDISLSESASLYDELKNNHWLDGKSYLTAVSDTISARITANPAAYPVSSSLSPNQFVFFMNELDIMFAAHQFYSDFNRTTIHFLMSPCQ